MNREDKLRTMKRTRGKIENKGNMNRGDKLRTMRKTWEKE
jgi:hypothetical protein